MKASRIVRLFTVMMFCFCVGMGAFQGAVAVSDIAPYNVKPPGSANRIVIREFRSIRVPVNPDKAEAGVARLVQKKIGSMYKISLEIKPGLPADNEAAILIGRDQALASGIVSAAELEAVKQDGYVIKGAGNRIVIAGYALQGTIYGAHAFLRQIGLKVYPWHHSPDDSIEIFTPPENGTIEAISISSKPFFEYRDMVDHLDRGRFGGTLRQYSLGDLRFAQEQENFRNNGYLGWDHTAGYLVPMQLYRDRHPEYFAVDRKGEPIPKSTPNLRVNLCMCLPEVVNISTHRALEWLNMQKDRKYFAITDGDAVERCPSCELTDPIPDYHTDRTLTWVNSVARALSKEHPEKILLTAAYFKTVKPPLKTGMEPNVLVMYAPWYWDSRATSAVGFAHPLNVVAMEEFMGWSLLFPDQIGVYDYPGGWVHGTAERIKFYARNKVRWLYFNAPEGNLLHWVGSQLLWDPLLDTSELEREFVQAFYGPAADTMGEFLLLQRAAIETGSWHSRKFFSGVHASGKARALLDRAVEIAMKSDLETQTRILEGVSEGLHTMLMNARTEQMNDSEVRRDIELYKTLGKRILANCKSMRFSESIQDKRRKMHQSDLESLVKALLEDNGGPAVSGQTGPGAGIAAHSSPVTMTFNSSHETGKWRSDASRTDLISPPTMAAIGNHAGMTQQAVKLRAPLSRLPVLPRGNITMHAGRFHAERGFNPPLDTGDRHFLDFHLYASRDTPVTIYINKNLRLRSDAVLHAGEQIVRVDLRNFPGNPVSRENWDRKLTSIGIDVLPQDNFYPYPKVQDTEILFLGMEAKGHDPRPAMLPHQGKAVWMTHFRANVPHEEDAVVDVLSGYKRLMASSPLYKSLWRSDVARWKGERFRAFTAHRFLSPLFAILTGKTDAPETGKAARAMQKYLMQAYGVELPINPPGLTVGPYTRNAILLGKEAGLAAEGIRQAELERIGPDGFVINARNGRIVIAGNDGNGTHAGVVRLLNDHGLRLRIPGVRDDVPRMADGFLHELYLLDWPFFSNRDIRCDAPPSMNQSAIPLANSGLADSSDALAAASLAADIKRIARRGENRLPQEMLAAAAASPLSCYIVSELSWNPFADATGLMRQFRQDVVP